MHTNYAPPMGYEAPASFSFNAATDWARIVAKGLSFELYDGNNVSLRFVTGTCLNPLLIEGQHALLIRPFADGEAIIDGDMYVIEWADEAKTVIAKYLKFICGDWYAQCAESIAKLDGTIIGKVIGVLPTGSADSQQIANLAVTESFDSIVSGTAATVSAGSTTVTTTAGGNSFTLPALAANCTVKVRVEYESHTVSGTTFSVSDNAFSSVGGVATALTNQIRQNWILDAGDSVASQVTNISSLSFTAGQTPTFGVTVTSGAGTGTAKIKNVRYWIMILKK